MSNANNNPPRPREYFVPGDILNPAWASATFGETPLICVIEKSAYEQVCKERDSYEQLTSELQLVIELTRADAKAMAEAIQKSFYTTHLSVMADTLRAALTPERRERYGV